MDIINKINEAINKPTFEQFFFAKKNYKKFQKEFDKLQSEYAMEYGNDIVDDEQYYPQDEDEYEEVDPAEAYDNFAHGMGYQAEYDAASDFIDSYKRKYNYQKGDENEEKAEMLIDYFGYSTSFGNYSKKKKQDYWKMAE